MSTKAELQQQLELLRKRHAEELQQEVAAFEKINREIAEMQELTETLEQEERELERRFGAQNSSRGDGGATGGLMPFIGDFVLGLVDSDDSRSKRR
ncbi:hypothetical protein LSM04_009006 [Trypanosoma melophagium]|uniref:uncharacterized protein n=1 Tax=Trypanosoma melophagium TaxID=715481 RepID=UPI00351A65CE|nr:hypothetical protein LSM04_009006 [Trypanosoma melophagium]